MAAREPPPGPWQSTGQLLLSAFAHVAIIHLPRATDRRDAMEATLHLLGVPFSSVEWAPTVDCREYGAWPEALVPRRDADGNASWLHSTTCKKTAVRHQMASKGGCLRFEQAACRRVAEAPQCGGVCYTLSVASALRSFLRTNRTRLLLLEDDVCAKTRAAAGGGSPEGTRHAR
jgi:hypothetical protein